MMDASNLVWLDLEMTGLDADKERIIEAAMIVTDTNLNILAQSPIWVVHQSDALLAAMDEWNRTTHGGTGLLQRVRDSRLAAADAEALESLFDQTRHPFLAQLLAHRDSIRLRQTAIA